MREESGALYLRLDPTGLGSTAEWSSVPEVHCVPIRRLLKNARRLRSGGLHAGGLTGFATERDSLHYSTVSVPSMPDSRCPATEQKKM